MELRYKDKTLTSSNGSGTIVAGGDSFPSGGIIIWSGSADNVPTGWHICDGTEGTPDLTGKFVLGSSATHAVGETGGTETVALTTKQLPNHSHAVIVQPEHPIAGATNGQVFRYSSIVVITNSNAQSINTLPIGGSQPHENMPPYYALCYIMKL